MLEELLALGHAGAEYDAWLIRISDGEQFGSGFVAANPNSKIPALVDRSGPTPIRVFESGAILLHLAEKFGAFLPADGAARAECLSWLFWQMGSAPFLGGGFGHFYAYAPSKIEYAIDRYAMEVKRQLDVLDRRLAESRLPRRRRLHDRRHRRLALVRRARQGPALRRGRVPRGARLHQRAALDRRDRAAAGGAARPHGQPHLGRAVEPAARAPRRERFRDADRGQARTPRPRAQRSRRNGHGSWRPSVAKPTNASPGGPSQGRRHRRSFGASSVVPPPSPRKAYRAAIPPGRRGARARRPRRQAGF